MFSDAKLHYQADLRSMPPKITRWDMKKITGHHHRYHLLQKCVVSIGENRVVFKLPRHFKYPVGKSWHLVLTNTLATFCSHRWKGRLIYNITHLEQVMTLTNGQLETLFFFCKIMYYSAISLDDGKTMVQVLKCYLKLVETNLLKTFSDHLPFSFFSGVLTLHLLGYFTTRHLLGGGVKRPQSITREPIAAATRARRHTKVRDKTLPMMCFNLKFEVPG